MGGTQYLRGHSPPFESQSPPMNPPPSWNLSPPPQKSFAAGPLYSSEICLGLFNIACFFTEVSHGMPMCGKLAGEEKDVLCWGNKD